MSARRFPIASLLAFVLGSSLTAWAQQRPIWMKGAHVGQPSAIAVSLDGATIVTGASDSVVRVWDRATGSLRDIFHGHRTAIFGVAISPDGNFIASTSRTDYSAGEIRLWNLSSRSGAKLKVQGRNDFGPVAAAFSPDGSMLAVANVIGVDLFSMPDGRPAGTLVNEKCGALAIAFSPDGRHLATAGMWWNAMAVWDLSTRDTVFVRTFEWPVTTVAYSDDGKSLVASSGEYFTGAITLHEPLTGRTTDSIGSIRYPVYGARLTRDKTRLLFRTEWGLRAIDRATGRTIDSIECDTETPIGLDPSTETLVGATMGEIFRWRPLFGSSTLASPMTGFARGEIPMSPDERTVAVRSGDSIRFIEIATGNVSGSIHGLSESARFTAGGDSIVSVDSISYWNSIVRRRAVATGEIDTTLRLAAERGTYHWYVAIELSPDARLAAWAETYGARSCGPGLRSSVTIHELHPPFGSWRLDSGSTELMYVDRTRFSRDGALIAGASRDSVLRVWRVRTGELLDTLRVDAVVTAFAFDTEGRHVIIGTNRGAIAIYETDGMRLVRSHNAHRGPVNAFATSSDGQVLLSGGADGTIRHWHFPDGSNARTITYGAAITSLALTDDARRLIVTGADATVATFDAADVRDMSASIEHHIVDDAALQLWPNPTSGELRVRLPGSRASSATVIVTDVAGAIVARHSEVAVSESSGEIALDLRHLASGWYRLRVDAGESSRSWGFSIVR